MPASPPPSTPHPPHRPSSDHGRATPPFRNPALDFSDHDFAAPTSPPYRAQDPHPRPPSTPSQLGLSAQSTYGNNAVDASPSSSDLPMYDSGGVPDVREKEKEQAGGSPQRSGSGSSSSSPVDSIPAAPIGTGPRVHYPDDGAVHATYTVPMPPVSPESSPPLNPSVEMAAPRPTRPPMHSRLSSTVDLHEEMRDQREEAQYDWSDEEDVKDLAAALDPQQREKPRKGVLHWLTLLFSTFVGSIFISGCLVAVPVAVHYLYLLPEDPRTEHRQYVTDNIKAWFAWAAFNVTMSWWLALLVDLVPHVVIYFVLMIWGQVSEVLMSRIEKWQSIKRWIKPLLYAASGWASWAVLFGSPFFKLWNENSSNPSENRAHYTYRLYQVVKFFFFLILIYCMEKLLIALISETFHRTAYRERIDWVTKGQKILDVLSNYRPKRKSTRPQNNLDRWTSGYDDSGSSTPKSGKAFSTGRFFGGGTRPSSSRQPTGDSYEFRDGISSSSQPFATGQNTVSSSGSRSGTSTPRPGHVLDAVTGGASFVAKGLKKAALHDARNVRGEDGEGLTGFGINMGTIRDAKKRARDLWYALQQDPKKNYLVAKDFFPAFPTQEAAHDAFDFFDADGGGDITRTEIKMSVMKIYKERKFLVRSLHDAGQAVSMLDTVFMWAAAVILFFIALPLFQLSIDSFVTSVYSVGLAASFIFSNAATNMFNSIIFIFVTHPFDTGDRVFIDQENLAVKKMGIWATVFARVDGQETYYFNSQLCNKIIINVRRSGGMFENCSIQIAWNTPIEKLDQLEKELSEWMALDEQKRFQPATAVMYQRIDFQRSLDLTIGIPHRTNWQDWGAYNDRRTAFHAAVHHYTKLLGITYHNSHQPVYFSNDVRTIPSTLSPEEDERMLRSPIYPEDGPSSPPPMQPASARPPPAKPLLGFAPPPADRSGLRARKTINKKQTMIGDA